MAHVVLAASFRPTRRWCSKWNCSAFEVSIRTAMRIPLRWLSASLLMACTLVVIAASSSAVPEEQEPRPFREYPSFEGDDAAAPIPPDWNVPGELVVGRLMYPSAGGGRRFGGGFDWHQGGTG